jgi:2-polyprenyl-3-methyl-5-hydroxy-6-metoxy-1,4-benzoquinol methylase
MHYDDEYYLNILENNGGFNTPCRWLKYAKIHSFKRVKSQKLQACPDCGNDKLCNSGQYVYYSNLIQLLFCTKCGLYFSDTLLDPIVIKEHFENSYKDEKYFGMRRKPIYEYISLLADQHTPINGKVIDIGGGKGHLLQLLKNRRTDLNITLTDISKKSCDYCSEKFGINSICCSIPELEQLTCQFNTVLIIDVLYYDPNVNKIWRVFNRLCDSESGTLILRVPNKLKIIKFHQILYKYLKSNEKKSYQDHIKYFNPEHIFIFSSNYLRQRLKKLGFKKVRILPSPLLLTSNRKKDKLMGIFFKMSRLIFLISFGKFIITPSMIVIAEKAHMPSSTCGYR